MRNDPTQFLIAQFQEYFDHKRHFQNQRQAMISLYFTVAIAMPVALDKVQDNDYKSLLMLLFFVAGFLIFILLLMNRKYSTQLTRQINGIRYYFLKNQNSSIRHLFTERFLDSSFPPYLNFKSDSFVIFCLVALLNSFAICCSVHVFPGPRWQLQIIFLGSVILHLLMIEIVLGSPRVFSFKRPSNGT